ncbi:alpha/beta-hydrolase [Cryphonectria parasitica EP155]|uniref:Alpha/beta-hydrolase n=1 Tax=Cryphonectria parasitica (strain ATCC 38755 / EP155) TaxID=660469 RepID=A0A9P5CKE0_CRYP1|nr:alpha/beta-hydrolase [Cryphonectria parasitica EP155]KAF3760851.1 alpha/beta-hydrolase [Cryphonectria parasitica EP155]
MSKPTIIIVPGAWQKPSAFAGIVEKFQQAGYPTVHVPVPTTGGVAPTGLKDDVEAVRKVLVPLVEEGKEVVVIGHSSGGISMSGSVEGYDAASRTAAGKKGGVVKCIFLAAFVLPKGQSLLGMLGGQPLPWMVVEADRVSGNPDMIPQVGFNDLSAEEQSKWAKEMTYTSAALFATPAEYEPWASGIPCAYVYTSEDHALPLPVQQGMSSQLGPEAKTATLKAGHCPFLSMPDGLVKAVESVL